MKRKSRKGLPASERTREVCSEYWTCLYHRQKLKRERKGKDFHLRMCCGSSTRGCTCHQFEQALWLSACPSWVCVSITRLVYAMRGFIQHFLKIQFGFLLLLKCKILGDLRQPGRKAASFLAVFWQRFAGTFMQNLLVFLQHSWVALTNKSSFLLFLLFVLLSSGMQISMQREHTLIWEQRLWFFFWLLLKESFQQKRLLSLEKSLLWGARWPQAIPWPHLWLILSVQQLEPPSARGNSFTSELENCKHIYLLNMNNLHVLCRLTI